MEPKKKIPEKQTINKKQKTIIISISLIFHAGILLILLSFSFKKSQLTLRKLYEQLQKIPRQKIELPAALKPRKSNFGTFVYYEKPEQIIPKKFPEEQEEPEPEPEPEKQKKPQLTKAPKPEPEEHKEEVLKKPEKLTEVEQEIKTLEKIEEDLKIVEEHKIKEKAPSVSAEATSDKKLVEKKEPKKKEIKKTKPIKKTLKEKEKLEEELKKIEDLQKKLAKLETQKDRRDVLRTRPQPKKKKRNIISMTRGFVENLVHKGNDWLERKGDENKRPDFKELKYLSYEQRINWQLQAAWKRHRAHQKTFDPLFGKAAVNFKIDLHGNISDLKLIKSSGKKQLDEAILKNIRQAAPFPPLPKHFKKTIYSTGRIIHVAPHSFGF